MMTREIRRVPPRFAWSLGRVWPGYLNPTGDDRWQPAHPPSGCGYQLWETTSEGSPISPVFASPDALCARAADHASPFGDIRRTAAEWRRLLTEDGAAVRIAPGIFVM
jgi:hypothetical protein